MIIGLVGYIGSGKGSVADYLQEKYGYNKESFAASVKDAVSIIFGWNRELLEGDTLASRKWRESDDPYWSDKLGTPFSPRLALQLMGTEAGRNVFHPDIWIYSLERRMNPNKDYVVADVRFVNEINNLTRMGGKIIRVKRNDPDWTQDALDYISGKTKKEPIAHYSEWAWMTSPGYPEFDGLINNDGNLSDLKKKVDKIMGSLYN